MTKVIFRYSGTVADLRRALMPSISAAEALRRIGRAYVRLSKLLDQPYNPWDEPCHDDR